MQHMVNKAHPRWVAANLISGHLAHAGNHRQWDCRAQPAQVQRSESIGLGKTDGLRPGSGCYGGLTVLWYDAMRGNCDNCSHTPTETYLHKSAHRP